MLARDPHTLAGVVCITWARPYKSKDFPLPEEKINKRERERKIITVYTVHKYHTSSFNSTLNVFRFRCQELLTVTRRCARAECLLN